MKKYIIITTINPKSEAISKFEQMEGWNIILVGDKKSQRIESNEKITFLSVEDQEMLGFGVVDHCPYNHYARKNIGYLYALKEGADFIYDTDDDNLPYDNWAFPEFECENLIETENGFYNIYSHFSDEFVWPRGYPIDEVHSVIQSEVIKKKTKIGVWQGMADINPDVDAIFRLIINKNIMFNNNDPVALPENCYCPFNSQNTLWNREMIPYAYLPATTSFRFTDILRGYIAQRMMWEHHLNLGFIGATVYQERNPHDLMRDFQDEVECYLGVKKLMDLLSNIELSNSYSENLLLVYGELAKIGMVRDAELKILGAWLSDLERIL